MDLPRTKGVSYDELKSICKTVEQEVHDQLKQLMSVNVFRDAKVRIMPDTHAGKGCVIGFTANLGDKVVPNLVGVDVGCSCYVGNLGKIHLSDSSLADLDSFIRENIPSGMNVNNRENSVGFADLCGLHMWGCLRNVEHLHASIGSLGGGNHFISIECTSDGTAYLVIHTGSRNLGQQVCHYYQEKAIKSCNDHKVDVQSLVDKLKSEGRQKEIANAIKELKMNSNKIPDDLCYLEGVNRNAYLHDMKICQKFAWQNREEIARRIMNHLKVASIERFQTVHNYIDFEDNLIRKGAIRCNKGEKVIIPLNMRDGSIIGIGKGNKDWNCSGPHGAGRLMSRKKAKQSISMKDFADSMSGIYTTSVNEGTLDESPMAYKNAQEIIEAVKDTVDIVEVIRPIYNFKASE